MKIYCIRLKHIIIASALTIILLLCIILLSRGRGDSRQAFSPVKTVTAVIIDAGHGGLDGGAVSADGQAEAPLNLAISQKVRDVMTFFGIRTLMTRDDEASLNYSDDNTIRENKRADLTARLAISQANPDMPFLSIHLNMYKQTHYRGAQVFYSPNNQSSLVLASCVQEKMRQVLDESNNRRAKLSPTSVMLMEKITAPAVTIECGFLSNPEELALLNSPEYQTKIAISIFCGYIDYLELI